MNNCVVVRPDQNQLWYSVIHTCVRQSNYTALNTKKKPFINLSYDPSLYRWITDEWSACTKTCGGGIMERTVICIEESNGIKNKVKKYEI